MIEIRTLSGVSFSDIEKVFNESFSDYYFPINFTEAQFREKYKCEGGNLDLSVGAFENGGLVGFIMHYVAQVNSVNTIYNGGTGVIPSRRGQGLTKRMYTYILPILEKSGIKRMILEALTVNEPAIKVYEQLGFKRIRTVDCFKGELNLSPIVETEYEVRNLKEYDWEKLQSFWDYPPTWQNSILVMDYLKNTNLAIGAYLDNELCGYIIYNPETRRIYQLATDKQHRQKGIGSLLLHEISKNEQLAFTFINQDMRMKEMSHLLNTSGMLSFTQQYEMEAFIGQ